MKFRVKHEICGRSRIHVLDGGFTFKEADIYEYSCFKAIPYVLKGIKCILKNRE